MKKLSSKAKKVIIALTVCVVVLALVIAIPNIYLTQIGKQLQIGTPGGYDWSAEDTYDTQKITSLDMGDGDFKILVLTDIHRKNHGTFAAELGINYLLDGVSEIAIKNLVKKDFARSYTRLGRQRAYGEKRYRNGKIQRHDGFFQDPVGVRFRKSRR